MKRLFIYDPANERREVALGLAMDCARQWGGRATITVADPAKSRPQEEKYHAIIGEIAAAERLYGKKLSPESWKRLLIDAFKHATKDDPDLNAEWDKFGGVEVLPALNHPGFVMVGEQSRKFSKKLASAFIEWLLAFQSGAERDEAA